MRDVHQLEGPKIYVESIEEAMVKVQIKYPIVTRQGAVGSWSFYDGETLVAEAWMHRTRPGWWLRISDL